MYCDYTSKVLYRQHSMSEEGHDVDAVVYALSWRYPGTMGMVTTRARMTIVTNFEDNDYPNVFAVNIELWKDSGWIGFEEYFDDSLQDECLCMEDVEKKCLKVLESFFVGGTLEEQPVRKPGTRPPKPPKRTNATIKKNLDKRQTPPNESSDQQKTAKVDEEPDFEWI